MKRFPRKRRPFCLLAKRRAHLPAELRRIAAVNARAFARRTHAADVDGLLDEPHRPAVASSSARLGGGGARFGQRGRRGGAAGARDRRGGGPARASSSTASPSSSKSSGRSSASLLRRASKSLSTAPTSAAALRARGRPRRAPRRARARGGARLAVDDGVRLVHRQLLDALHRRRRRGPRERRLGARLGRGGRGGRARGRGLVAAERLHERVARREPRRLAVAPLLGECRLGAPVADDALRRGRRAGGGGGTPGPGGGRDRVRTAPAGRRPRQDTAAAAALPPAPPRPPPRLHPAGGCPRAHDLVGPHLARDDALAPAPYWRRAASRRGTRRAPTRDDAGSWPVCRSQRRYFDSCASAARRASVRAARPRVLPHACARARRAAPRRAPRGAGLVVVQALARLLVRDERTQSASWRGRSRCGSPRRHIGTKRKGAGDLISGAEFPHTSKPPELCLRVIGRASPPCRLTRQGARADGHVQRDRRGRRGQGALERERKAREAQAQAEREAAEPTRRADDVDAKLRVDDAAAAPADAAAARPPTPRPPRRPTPPPSRSRCRSTRRRSRRTASSRARRSSTSSRR